MESFTSFMDIFVRCIKENNPKDLVEFLKDSYKYFQGLTTDESKQALSNLFNSEKGLLTFLRNELNRSVSRKSFDNVVIEVFSIIKFIIDNLHMIFHQYILPVKDICQLVLIMHCSKYIKRIACSTLKKLIETFEENELNLDETIGEFMSEFYKLTINERSFIFSIFGTIAEHHPQVPNLQRHKNDIFKLLFNDFKNQYNPSLKNQPNEIQIYLEVLTNILNDLYTPEDIDSEYYAELYQWIKYLSTPNLAKKHITRTTIVFLSKHINLFSTFVYDDYIYWYKLFLDLTKEKDANGQCGQQALKAYYNNLEIVLKSSDADKNKAVFLNVLVKFCGTKLEYSYFKNLFKKQLMDPALDPNSLRLVVYGFSKLAAPCKIYFSNDVKDMYLLIAGSTVPFFLRENVEQVQFENITDYQEALSEILRHVLDVSIGQINLLIKISVFSIKRYPDFSGIRKTYAISSLIKTIINVASINKILLDEFLHNIILDGIAWTCSHTLRIDAELLGELHNLSKNPICYKNYLPLWLELLKPSRYKYEEKLIPQQIFDKIVNIYIMLITKLNLNTRIKEDCILSDAAFSQTAENEKDFRIFLNMVDLMIDIINRIEPFLLENTIHKFLYEIIRMSYKYPLISGFYKLVHAIMKNSEIFSTLDNEDDNNTEIQELVYNYLINTLDQIITFSNELLTACLYLIMCIPIKYVSNVLNRTIPTFKIAITMSLNDFDLASVILDTLEKWISHLDREDTKDFLLEIIPNLELFLQSNESSTELLQDIIKSERKVVKYITLIDNENALENLQRRILLFLGSLDSDVLLDVAYRRALNTGSTWDKKDLLKCMLYFPDLRIEFHFDKIFPRLITLAQSSGDRRTKVIASELLHKMVSFILGKTKQHLTMDIDRFATLYEALYPVLLDLCCDSDEVVWKLFQPLMIQLSHWLSSQFMFKSLITALFINSLFDGLCNNEKSSVREFSGLCLSEFIDWSLRQFSETNELNGHVRGIIRKITNFAVHPSKTKRMAAATAFNHLYRIMREHEDIITIYWLELLYCFIKSLEGYNDISIHNALNHINKVIQVKADLLNEDNPLCRKPSAFTGRTLTDAVNWLFTQCGSLDPNCRQKSMELFVQISNHLLNYNSPTEVIESYIEKNGIQEINCIILKDLKAKGENLSFQNMLLLSKSLDCYIWLINNKLINMDYLFTDINPDKDVIFDYIRNFVHLLLETKTEKRDKIVISKEIEQLQMLQCKIIMTIFNFIQILLNLNSNIIPDFIFNEELFELIAKCVICPQALGFDMRNVTINEQLPILLEQLLQVLVQKMNDSSQYCFKRKIESYAMKHCATFLTLHENNEKISTEIKEYIKGLILLENCNILSQLCKDQQAFDNFERDVECIFKSLSKEEAGINVCVGFHIQTIEYLQSIMKLFLTTYKPSMTKKLINLIENNDVLLGLDSIEITHGEYFLSTFKDAIFGYILKNIEESMIILEDLLEANVIFAFTMLEDLMLFAQHHKNKYKDYIESLVTTVIKKFIILDRAVSNIECRKEKLINIYGICVHLMHCPINVAHMSEYFYQWILKEFARQEIDIEYKTKLLQNFLVCLTDISSTYKPELVTILRTLRKDRLLISHDVFSQHSMIAMKIKNCFYMLLTLLPITKSLMVYETIIFFAANGGEYLFTEKLEECMKKYFNTIPSNCALKSLEMSYKYFMDLNSFGNDTTSSRFDILQKFLLPMFQYCNITEIEQFYENNIKDIYTIITKNLVGNNIDKQQLIISTIGCYELVSIMFAKIDIQKITSVDSTITKNAIDNVDTGTELLSGLYANTLRVRSLRTDNPEHKEIMRLLHCSAYNCSIAIVSLKDNEQAYMSIFAENKNKNMLIWDNIIDLDKKYNIQQTVKNYSKNKKKLINIKKTRNQQYNTNENNYSYIYSYNIAESTLYEDLNAYDLNEAHIINQSKNNNNKEESMSLLFESDDLNDHECMPSICGVLIHMMSKGIYATSNEDNLTLPKSLKYFHDSMLIQRNNNVRLFILKIILNTSQLFEHYAKFFLLPIIATINSYLFKNTLNYIITDALLTLIDWHKVAVPNETKEKEWAQKLFEKLITKILLSTENTSKAIYKHNVNIIRTMVQVWHQCLQVPTNFNEIMINSPKTAIHLILMFLANNTQVEIICRDDILEFLQNTVENWQEDEEMVLQNCEALGIIFKLFKNDTNYSNKLHDIGEKLQSSFRQMQMKFANRQIRCIQALCKNYPEVATEYFEFIMLSMSKVDSNGRAICLELFLLTIPQHSKEQIIKKLNYIKFHSILQNRIVLCEKIALQIIHELVLILEPLDLLPLAKLVSPYTKHDFSEYREIAYKIFMNIYNKYSKMTLCNDKIEELKYLSKQTLLGGLLDPATELQTKILHFWTEDNNLPNKITDRLLEILNIYSPNTEDVFLPFIPLTMLHLLTKTVEYTSKMFEPLTNCDYKDYEIIPSWKTKNLGSIAPLFAPSLASQMNQVFTQTMSSTFNYDSFYYTSFQSNINFQATQDPKFEPTYPNEDQDNQMFLNDTEYDANVEASEIVQPADNKRSRRFLANSSDVSNIIKQREIIKNLQHAKMIKKEAIRQRNSVKLCRKYRSGDFPDIEISLSDLIEPLQNLIKNDQLICKDITVAIFSSLIEAIKLQQNINIIDDIVSILKQILCNCQGNSPLMAAMLETMLTCHITDCSSDITTKISKANHFNSIATLLLEENLIYYSDEISPPPQKRLCLAEKEIDEQTNKWIQLAKLYESMNEIDIVLSIFRDKIDNKHLQDSSFAQATSDWIRGKSAYETVYTEEGGGLIKEHCLQGLFKCLSHLSDWDKIDIYIKNRLDQNLDNIWNDAWKNWMFPWMFQVYVHKLILHENSEFDEFTKAVNLWFGDEQKLSYIKSNFGEELALFFLNEERVDARDFLNAALDELRKQWIHLHPLSVELKKKKLEKLQGISDIDLFLKYLKVSDTTQGAQDLLKFWRRSVPSVQDDILLWDKLILYRTNFASLYIKHLNATMEIDTQSDEENNYIYELQNISYQLSLDMINMAISHRNKFIANQHFDCLKKQIDNFSSHIENKYILATARLKYLKGEDELVSEKKLSYYVFSWKYSHKILNQNDLDVSLQIASRQHISMLATRFVQLSYENEQFVDVLYKNNTILKELDIEFSSIEDVRNLLESYSFKKMEECCNIGNPKDCYFILSKYCYDQFCKSSDNINLFKEFVNSTLKAMSYGSVDATHYFPCLLKHQYLNDDEVKEIFINNTNEIQSWLFLRWQAQLFSHLGTSIADLIIPIIERIIEDYPNALIYILRLIIETNPSVLNDTRMYKIRKFLYDNQELEQFLKAMQYVVQPESYLRYYLHECVKNLSKGPATAIDILMKKIPSSKENKNEPRPGNIYNIFNKFNLKKLEKMKDEKEIRQYLKYLDQTLKQSLQKTKINGLLKNYSPWLCEFTESQLEVPGQYIGYRKPMPQYHVKIMKIEPTVKVMESLRKPVRITIVGDDAKDYMFLNKFGEDLRLDQRLQQTFSIINKTLNTDIACKRRHLFIDTYQVIPLSTSLGLIEWIKDTKSLQDLIYFTLPKNKYDSIETEYNAWIQKAAASSRNLVVQYKEATLNYDANAVTIKMNELIAKTEWDLLRKTCITLCPSPESFITFRRNFITSYATMCAVHWILGVGDRHLSNILISIGSGKCLGVDFDQAFDAGIDSMIPQLMPFRLTTQILGLLKPFTEKDLFGATMTHVLKALQSDKSTILACLDVFIYEPLNWTGNVNKALERIEEVNTDVKWLPQKKISIIEKKLNGNKPSIITLEQLKDLYSDQYYERYYMIVNGDDGIKRTRLNIRNEKLTAEEQVECLLDQATDLNILGRTYVGWKPWL